MEKKNLTWEDHHVGLPEKELRDFFSIHFATLSRGSEKQSPPFGLKGFEYSLKSIELQIEDLNKEKIRIQTLLGLTRLMEERGWSEFDTSEHIGMNNNLKWYMSFIGTQEEFNNFIKKFE